MRVKTISETDVRSPEAPGDGWYIIEAAGDHPKRIPLPGGGSLTITQHLTPEVLARIAEAGVPASGLLIDRDHFAEDPDKPTEALGWVRELALCGDSGAQCGLAARIEWTPLGRPLIEGKIYRYFSTVYPSLPADTADGSVCTPTHLIGLALTNKPNNHHGQPPITNRQCLAPSQTHSVGSHGMPDGQEHAESVTPLLPPTSGSETQTETTDTTQNTTMNAEILKLLGLPESASEEEVIAAIGALKEGEKKAALAEADAVINSEAKAAGAELSDEEKEECRDLLLTNRDTGVKFTSLLCRSKATAPTPQAQDAPAPVQNRLYGSPVERPELKVTGRSAEDDARIAIHNRANEICREARARGNFKGYHTALAEAEHESRSRK